jgi:uncharacterized cupin superfamily protein
MREASRMTDDPNIFEPDIWDQAMGAVRGRRMGAAAGSVDLGCALYELDPGGQAAPYHIHHANEELLIVLNGSLELRTPAGVRAVERGAVVAFPVGPDGAHRVRNASDAPARYLIVSTMRVPEVAEHVDTGTVLAMTGAGSGWAFPSGSDADFLAVVTEAIQADRAHG